MITRPNKVTNKLLAVLPERSIDVLTRRFGLGQDSKRITLEAIGRDYGITRERVRQIENNALRNIRKSEIFAKEQKTFEELGNVIDVSGGIIAEVDLLESLAKNEKEKNQIHFLLTLGNPFVKEKENTKFKTRWYMDRELSNQVHILLDEVYDYLNEDDLYPEEDIVSLFLDRAENVHTKYKKPEIIKIWLSISKVIGKNHFNEWGLSSSNNINAKGVRDYAYLSIRQHGSPMHFTEVAKSIENNFGKKAHVATCHNELIKDSRFVLVGRGLYALSEWGYMGGVVRDVIKNILEKEGLLTREEIVDRVLKERYIKENTVIVNLQDPKYFKRDNKGKYLIV